VDRRAFVAGSLTLLAAPLAAGAQLTFSAGKVARLGFLSNISPNADLRAAFREGLRELGYREGQNLLVEYRSAEGHYERLPDLAAQLVRLNVDVIVATGTPAPNAAKRATSTIPIIITNHSDPVGSGLVASLARPGGNVTGLSIVTREAVGKHLELVRETVPRTSRLAVLSNPTNPVQPLMLREAESAARSLNVRLQSLEARTPSDLSSAFAAATRESAGALVVLSDPMFFDQSTRIAELAARSRLPVVAGQREYVQAGSLLAYGASLRDNFRRVSGYVDRILKGAKPGDLPIEQPIKFELVINLKTAKALGLTIPPAVLARADEVIQ
jgi:putative ABC transport system substrate-binding protein